MKDRDARIKKARNKNLDEALQEIQRFISSLTLNDETKIQQNRGMELSSPELGSVTLAHEESDQFSECVDKLYKAVTETDITNPEPYIIEGIAYGIFIEIIRHEVISRRGVEKLLQRAILSSLDPAQRNQDTPCNTRVSQSIDELRQLFRSDSQPFKVCIPVQVVHYNCLPRTVGQVEFRLLDEAERERREYVGQKDIFAVVHLQALNAQEARDLAEEEIHLTLDIINFCMYNTSSSSLRLVHPYFARENSTGLVFDRTDSIINSVSSQCQRVSVLFIEDVEGDESPPFWVVGLENASELLAKRRSTKLNKTEKQLLAAVRWAGRAKIEDRPEVAFLLYAIAIESIILADSDNAELTFRLKTRVAHLMVDSHGDRIKEI